MSAPALLPCPFCGEPGKIRTGFDASGPRKKLGYFVECQGMECTVALGREQESDWQTGESWTAGKFSAPEAAAAAWNTRLPAAALALQSRHEADAAEHAPETDAADAAHAARSGTNDADSAAEIDDPAPAGA